MEECIHMFPKALGAVMYCWVFIVVIFAGPSYEGKKGRHMIDFPVWVFQYWKVFCISIVAYFLITYNF